MRINLVVRLLYKAYIITAVITYTNIIPYTITPNFPSLSTWSGLLTCSTL